MDASDESFDIKIITKCFEEEDPNTEELLSLLQSWQQEYLADYFIKQKIFINVLKVIKQTHIDKLFKNYEMGIQILFEHNLETWRKSLDIADNEHMIPLTSSCHTDSDSSSSRYSYEQPASSSISTSSTLCNILNETRRGVMLCEYYSKNNKFLDEHRSLLINMIAEYFIEKQHHLSLPASLRLEKEIVERFPTEKLEFYRMGKRGKIYNKFCNLNYSLKICKTAGSNDVLKKKKCKRQFEPEEDADIVIRSLKFDNLSVNKFDHLWQRCVNYRLNTINDADSLSNIVNKWPEYKKTSGYQFINMDYHSKFKKTQSIVGDWENKSKKLIEFLSTSVKEKNIKQLLDQIKVGNCNENGRNAMLLLCMHGYLVPTGRIVKKDLNGKKKTIKFTIKDSQDSFLYWGTSHQEVQDYVEFLNNQNGSVHPFILVVGGKISHLNEIYLYMEGVKYNILSILQAVDICYKAYRLFNLDYPAASVMFWDFIEHCFYKTSPNKSKFPKVHVLMNELETM